MCKIEDKAIIKRHMHNPKLCRCWVTVIWMKHYCTLLSCSPFFLYYIVFYSYILLLLCPSRISIETGLSALIKWHSFRLFKEETVALLPTQLPGLLLSELNRDFGFTAPAWKDRKWQNTSSIFIYSWRSKRKGACLHLMLRLMCLMLQSER